MKGEKGVAIMINKRWRNCIINIQVCNERLLAVDVHILHKRFRFIVVYMPHGGCRNEVVEGIYDEISILHEDALKKNLVAVCGGDWNASVGQRCEGECSNVVGEYGHGNRNDRGTWFVQWATSEKLMIANTFFDQLEQDRWTHSGNGGCRQIDFICFDQFAHRLVEDARASSTIGVGKDHRGVQSDLVIPSRGKRRS